MNKISRAICFATEKFDGAYRKDNKTPTVFHSLEAASIVLSVSNDEDVVCAALLHDTIEDAGATKEQISEMFGERVASLVCAETENKYGGVNKAETWVKRKQETLDELSACNDIGAKAIWLGDKLSNMRSFYELKQTIGSKMWDQFNQKDPKKHEWYFREIAKELKVFDGSNAYSEYLSLLDKVFQED